MSREPDGRAGNVQLWDGSRGMRLFDPVPMPCEPRGLAFRPGGALLAVVCANGLIALVDTTAGKVLRTLDSRLPSGSYGGDNLWWANGAGEFSADGRRLATWGLSRTVEVWEVDSGRLLHHLAHDERIHEAVFSADGEHASDRLARQPGPGLEPPHGRARNPAPPPSSPGGPRPVHQGWPPDHHTLRRWIRAAMGPAKRPAAGGPRLRSAHSPGLRLLARSTGAGGGRHQRDLGTGLENRLALAPCLRDMGGDFWSVRATASGDLVAAGNDGRLIGCPLTKLRRPSTWPAEEQRLLAELISGEQVQENGVLVPLTAEEWLIRWRQLKK